MKGLVICALVVLAMSQLTVEPSQAIACGDVTSSLSQCTTYLTGMEKNPRPACCAGIKHIQGVVPTTADKRFACNCIKQVASGISNIKDSAVSALPGVCNAPLPFSISKSFDCNSIP